MLRLGTGVALHSKSKPVKRADCSRGWHRVEPQGWVCLDEHTTLDRAHPLLLAKQRFHAAKPEALSWGQSRETPVYRKLPTPKEQKRSEYQLEKHLSRLELAREALKAGEPIPRLTARRLRGVDLGQSKGEPPAFLRANPYSPWSQVFEPQHTRPRAKIVPPRSSIAWIAEFEHEGRSWLLTPELFVIPRDRVLRQTPSSFRGVDLQRHKLPLTFIRKEPRQKWRLAGRAVVPAAERVELRDGDDPWVEVKGPGKLERLDETWSRLSWVGLTGRSRWQRGKRFLETREAGTWIAYEDATPVVPRAPRGFELDAGEKWIDVSIYRGTLVAYEGERPVFATLISPGLNGYQRKKGPKKKNSTPSGTFRIEWKHRSTTMTPDPEKLSYYLTDVPYTQFFHMPFALHAAYWHDRFGEPKSGGCVNLSLKDARWLFDWTEPSVPEGWYGVRSGGSRGEGTWVRVR